MNTEVVLHIVIAIVLAVTLMMIISYKVIVPAKETLYIYDSGASLRRLGTEFTGTNQGTSSYVPNVTYTQTLQSL